jgi:hypothetical protein
MEVRLEPDTGRGEAALLRDRVGLEPDRLSGRGQISPCTKPPHLGVCEASYNVQRRSEALRASRDPRPPDRSSKSRRWMSARSGAPFFPDRMILGRTRWKLREMIRLVNRTLAELHVEEHPDRTFIGRISRGFDFLGDAFTPTGLEASPPAVERCVERMSQLDEPGVDLVHIGTYVRRRLWWASSGIRSLGEDCPSVPRNPSSGPWIAWGWLGGCLPSLVAAVTAPPVGAQGDGTDRR